VLCIKCHCLTFCFSYVISNGICYLVLCDATFSKKLAFSYLEELSSEFFVQYGNRVDSVTRPYAFIEFGEC